MSKDSYLISLGYGWAFGVQQLSGEFYWVATAELTNITSWKLFPGVPQMPEGEFGAPVLYNI